MSFCGRGTGLVELKLGEQLEMEVVELFVHYKAAGSYDCIFKTNNAISPLQSLFKDCVPSRHNSPIGSRLQHNKRGMTDTESSH
jgi:hypothetical protein